MLDRLKVLLAVAAMVGLITGCDEEETDDPCEGVANACATDGAERCNGGGDGMESCGENADGCLVWTSAGSCGSRQSCDDSGGSPSCGCSDECATEDEASCDGDEIVTCSADSDGCLYLETTEDCGASGEVCDETGGTPGCIAGCTDECDTEDETWCDGDEILTCSMGTDGCLDETVSEDCGDSGESCDDSGDAPECVVGCTDECDTEDATWCEGQSIMTCSMGTDGCLDVTLSEDCGAAPENLCDATGSAPACVGCGACDTAGDYCDLSASPPACVTAGTVAEILEGVPIDTPWHVLNDEIRQALEARAQATFATYRDAFGPDALDDAVSTMLTSPTSEMNANYVAFLEAIFGVSSITDADLDDELRQLYVLVYFAWQIWTVNYHAMPAVTWDGVTAITYMMMPDTASMDAYEAMGAELTDAIDALRTGGTLSDAEHQIAEHAMALARQIENGSDGYHFGADILSTVHGLMGNAFDFMLNYADFVYGNIFGTDVEFLDQVNAYLFSELIRIWEGSAVAAESQMSGMGDREYVEMFIGDPAESEAARLFLLLGNLFYDRVMALPDIDEPCYLYSAEEQARIWDAFTADSYADNDGLGSFESIHADFLLFAADQLEGYQAVMADALVELFPADCAAMTVAERDAIIAAVNAATTLGAAKVAFDDGLAAAGDGTAPDVLAAALAAITIIGGRDYDDPDDGATWLAEDEATLQAMWDEVRDWLIAEYGLSAADIAEDLTVIAGTGGYVVEGEAIYPAGRPRQLRECYEALIFRVHNLVNLSNGFNIIGPAFSGLALNTGAVLDSFLDATLTGDEAANQPFYRLVDLDRQARLLGGDDVTIRRFFADTCPAEGQIEWIRTTLTDEWDVPADMIDRVTSLTQLGPWYFGVDYDMIVYRGILGYLQGRLDTDHGAGTYSVDPFVLQACSLWDPRADDATYSALVTCLTS